MQRKKVPFEPIDKNNVRVYSCGPTVYRNPHIGNMRAFHFDNLLRNTIKYILGYKVTHVMNMTDVGHLTDDGDDGEDKMEKGAQRDNLTVRELADKYIANFKRYLAMLDMQEFDILCRATDNIQEQIDLIKTLEEKGYTYIIPDDGVYMDTTKVEEYGKLCRLDAQSRREGARIQNANKKSGTDFALRKFSPTGSKRQMERDSPWGKGFPGRHLECSAMAMKYLGDQFDIHTGGVDHIGVHHTNEIAQSECATGKKPRVKYWMHNQFLNLGGKKISKAEGGLITLDDIVAKGYDSLDLKYLFLTAHYRSFLDFNDEALDKAAVSRKNLKKKLSNHKIEKVDKEINPMTEEGKKFWKAITDALLDDLNTPKLLAEINIGLTHANDEIIQIIHWLDQYVLRLGLFEKDTSGPIEEIPEEVKQLAQQRWEAKQNKDRDKSDQLRDELLNLGYMIKDDKNGYDIVKA